MLVSEKRRLVVSVLSVVVVDGVGREKTVVIGWDGKEMGCR